MEVAVGAPVCVCCCHMGHCVANVCILRHSACNVTSRYDGVIVVDVINLNQSLWEWLERVMWQWEKVGRRGNVREIMWDDCKAKTESDMMSDGENDEEREGSDGNG